MLKADRIVIGAGVIVVIISLILAFATGDTQSTIGTGGGGPGEAAKTVTVKWTTQTKSFIELGGANSATETVTVLCDNLTSLEFILSWTDDDPGPATPWNRDELTLTISGPGGEDYVFNPSNSVSQDDGSITITVTLNTVPTNTTLTAKELESEASKYGRGPWNAQIEVQPNGLLDDGNAWTLAVSYSFYTAAIVSPSQSLEQPSMEAGMA